MQEQQYKIVGWSIFGASIALAAYWCLNEKGLTGWLIDLSKETAGQRLTLISWIVTILVVVLPGYILKNYFMAMAWNAHVDSLPPPDRSESARRSKYIKDDVVAPLAPANPVRLTNLPPGQQEFIATCPACGNLFPAKKNTPDLKCPQCGEQVPT
ncbi:MAG TPA: hypothetical protein VLH08_19880 [Acidobacteriota bacterium]|nr:hypothetical protein [Acidobacteriota bacterium]